MLSELLLRAKRAAQAEGQYGAARRGTSGGPGGRSGGGVAGYSRELLGGALIYAGRLSGG